MSDEKTTFSFSQVVTIVICTIALCVTAANVFLILHFRSTPMPTPGPSPVAPLVQRLASTMAGENIADDACQFGCYFECLAKLAEGGELTQKQQVVTLIEYTGRAGKKFTKGDYPNLPGILGRELEAWSSDLGEITPADRASLVVKLREIAAAFHTLAD